MFTNDFLTENWRSEPPRSTALNTSLFSKWISDPQEANKTQTPRPITPKMSNLNSYQPFVAGILSFAATAQAQLITNSTGLPPAGVYLSTDIHAIYGGPSLKFLLTLPEHAPLAKEVILHTGGNGTVSDAGDEIEVFGSTLTAVMNVRLFGTSITGGPQPISTNGPLGSVQVFTKASKVRLLSVDGTGTFDTEMLALSLSGNSLLGQFMVRERPSETSTGKTTITDIGGGESVVSN
jgi:hypothetical protein